MIARKFVRRQLSSGRSTIDRATEVLTFWFGNEEVEQGFWWGGGDSNFDSVVREKYEDVWNDAGMGHNVGCCELNGVESGWRVGRLGT